MSDLYEIAQRRIGAPTYWLLMNGRWGGALSPRTRWRGSEEEARAMVEQIAKGREEFVAKAVSQGADEDAIRGTFAAIELEPAAPRSR